MVEPSGVDYDQDGKDDACDGNIGEPPLNIPGRSPGIISGVNNNPTGGATQSPQTGSNLQQGTQTQSTLSGLQTGAPVRQDQNTSTGALLNQGLQQPGLEAVSAPYSSAASTGPYTGPNVINQTIHSEGPNIFLIGTIAFIVVFAAATAWNRYVKTPVPSRQRPKQ